MSKIFKMDLLRVEHFFPEMDCIGIKISRS
jgi:hypothetical protein